MSTRKRTQRDPAFSQDHRLRQTSPHSIFFTSPAFKKQIIAHSSDKKESRSVFTGYDTNAQRYANAASGTPNAQKNTPALPPPPLPKRKKIEFQQKPSIENVLLTAIRPPLQSPSKPHPLKRKREDETEEKEVKAITHQPDPPYLIPEIFSSKFKGELNPLFAQRGAFPSGFNPADTKQKIQRPAIRTPPTPANPLVHNTSVPAHETQGPAGRKEVGHSAPITFKKPGLDIEEHAGNVTTEKETPKERPEIPSSADPSKSTRQTPNAPVSTDQPQPIESANPVPIDNPHSNTQDVTEPATSIKDKLTKSPKLPGKEEEENTDPMDFEATPGAGPSTSKINGENNGNGDTEMTETSTQTNDSAEQNEEDEQDEQDEQGEQNEQDEQGEPSPDTAVPMEEPQTDLIEKQKTSTNFKDTEMKKIEKDLNLPEWTNIANQIKSVEDLYNTMHMMTNMRGETISQFVTRTDDVDLNPGVLQKGAKQFQSILKDTQKKIQFLNIGKAKASKDIDDFLNTYSNQVNDPAISPASFSKSLQKGKDERLLSTLKDSLSTLHINSEIEKETLSTITQQLDKTKAQIEKTINKIRDATENSTMTDIFQDVNEISSEDNLEKTVKILQKLFDPDFKGPFQTPSGFFPRKKRPLMPNPSTSDKGSFISRKEESTPNPPTNLTTTPPPAKPTKTIIIKPTPTTTKDDEETIPASSALDGYYGPYEPNSMEYLSYFPLPYGTLEFWKATKKKKSKIPLKRPVYLTRLSGSNTFDKLKKKDLPKSLPHDPSNEKTPQAKQNAYIIQQMKKYS